MALIAKPLPGSPDVPIAGSALDAPMIKAPVSSPVARVAPAAPAAPQASPQAVSAPAAPAASPAAETPPAPPPPAPVDLATVPGYVPYTQDRLFIRNAMTAPDQPPKIEIAPPEPVPGVGWGDSFVEAWKGSGFGDMLYSDTYWLNGASKPDGYNAANDPQVWGDKADPTFAPHKMEFLKIENSKDAAIMKQQMLTDAKRRDLYSRET